MRYELSIVATDGYEGDDFVGDLINWEKRRKAGQYILRYYNYQNMRCNFHPVSQIQGVFERGASITKEALNASSIERESPVKHETVYKPYLAKKANTFMLQALDLLRLQSTTRDPN